MENQPRINKQVASLIWNVRVLHAKSGCRVLGKKAWHVNSRVLQLLIPLVRILLTRILLVTVSRTVSIDGDPGGVVAAPLHTHLFFPVVLGAAAASAAEDAHVGPGAAGGGEVVVAVAVDHRGAG